MSNPYYPNKNSLQYNVVTAQEKNFETIAGQSAIVTAGGITISAAAYLYKNSGGIKVLGVATRYLGASTGGFTALIHTLNTVDAAVNGDTEQAVRSGLKAIVGVAITVAAVATTGPLAAVVVGGASLGADVAVDWLVDTVAGSEGSVSVLSGDIGKLTDSSWGNTDLSADSWLDQMPSDSAVAGLNSDWGFDSGAAASAISDILNPSDSGSTYGSVTDLSATSSNYDFLLGQDELSFSDYSLADYADSYGDVDSSSLAVSDDGSSNEYYNYYRWVPQYQAVVSSVNPSMTYEEYLGLSGLGCYTWQDNSQINTSETDWNVDVGDLFDLDSLLGSIDGTIDSPTKEATEFLDSLENLEFKDGSEDGSTGGPADGSTGDPADGSTGDSETSFIDSCVLFLKSVASASWSANSGAVDLWPVVVDMDGDGDVSLVSLDQSTAFFDVDGDNYKENVGWVAANDGLLVYDMDGDGLITDAKELSFKLWSEDAETDFDGLRLVFDTNGNGQLDQGDENFDKFYVWQDLNQDGISDEGELTALFNADPQEGESSHPAGITSIDLSYDDMDGEVELHDDPGGELKLEDVQADDGVNHFIYRDGNVLLRSTDVEWDGNGSQAGSAYDVTLKYSTTGYQKSEADGVIQLVVEGGNTDFSIKKITAADDQDIDLADEGYDVVYGNQGNDDFSTSGLSGVIIDGGAGDDTISGSVEADWLKGGDGADSISAGGGEDVLFIDQADIDNGYVDGGAGKDTAIAEGATGLTMDLASHTVEAVIGSDAADNLSTSGDTDVELYGQAGNDQLVGGKGDDILVGGEGADTLHGGDGDDLLSADADDLAMGSVDGGAGEDTLFLSSAVGSAETPFDLAEYNVETLHASGEDDWLTTSDTDQGVTINGRGGNDVIIGNQGDDSLQGGSGDDVLEGGFGADRLDGGAGSDTLKGGDGNDIYVFGHDRGTVTIDNRGHADDTDLVWLTKDVELTDMTFVKVGDDLHLELDSGDDTLIVQDWFEGSANRVDAFLYTAENAYSPEAIFVTGETGESYTLDDARGWNVFAMGGNDSVSGGAQDDFINGGVGNDFLAGETGADVLVGGAGKDTLSGGAGNDILSGGAGADTLKGGGGSDMVAGGLGADVIDGGSGSDTILYSVSSAGVKVNLSTGRGAGGDAQGDTISGIENVIGSNYDDSITGDGADNMLDGGEGDDTLSGGAGDDVLLGGAGADVLIGGAGEDEVNYAASQKAIEVDLSQADAGIGGDAEGDTFESVENIAGSSYDDMITGNDADNILFGDQGADTLIGSGGDDTLWGGVGEDVAQYSGVRGDYIITGENGLLKVSAGEGDTDTLLNVERIVFGEGEGATEILVSDIHIAEDGVINVGVDIDPTVGISGRLSDTAGLTYTLVGTHDGVTLNPDGTYTYKSADSTVREDSFTYQVVDANGIVKYGRDDDNAWAACGSGSVHGILRERCQQ